MIERVVIRICLEWTWANIIVVEYFSIRERRRILLHPFFIEALLHKFLKEKLWIKTTFLLGWNDDFFIHAFYLFIHKFSILSKIWTSLAFQRIIINNITDAIIKQLLILLKLIFFVLFLSLLLFSYIWS